MKKWIVALAALLALALWGAGALADQDMAVLVNGQAAPKLVEIDLSRGDTVQLTATEPVTWTRSSRRRCEVDENGLVKVLDAGSFSVTARAADGTRRVVNFRAVRGVLGVEITGANTMSARQSVKLKAAVVPANATNRRVSWQSSNPSVATVNGSGTVKAAQVSEVSTVVIYAVAQDGTEVYGSHTITVYPVASTVGIYLDGELVNGKTLDIDLAAASSLRLTSFVFPAAASQEVTWRVSSSSIAQVSGGLVTARRKGTVTVTVTANDGSRARATCKVRISVLSKGVTISGPAAVTAGKSIRLTASVQPANAGNRHVTWHSSNPSAASINSSGVVRAGSVSQATKVTITALARDGASQGSCTITVVPRATGIGIARDGAWAPNTLFLDSGALGSSIRVSAAVFPSDAAQAVKWSTNNARVATVSQDGVITCRGRGKAYITATAQDGSRVSNGLYVAVGDFSAMPYYIEVDKGNQVVRVYERGNGSYTHLIRRMICSTGHWNTHLYNDLYSMNGSRMQWCLAADRVLYMQYATRISGSYLFHGVPTQGRYPDRVKADYYNKLGSKASGGCVRLLCADAKWIYENVPSGTYVLVMEGARDPAEYGSVYAPPIRGGWDPTDDNPANPYYDPTYTSEVR